MILEDVWVSGAIVGVAGFTAWLIRYLMLETRETVERNTEAIQKLSIAIELLNKKAL